jgi:hypothetical protein
MRIRTFFKKAILCSSIAFTATGNAAINELPEIFKGDTPGSSFEISYDDLDALLKASVLETGKSNRASAKQGKAPIGTRLRVNINKLTALEGNRFIFESYKEDEQKVLLTNIRKSLEKLPSEADLKHFTKKEQLAYWLNLYNVTILEQIVKIYPSRKLEDFLISDESVLDEELLTVAGIKLSLNDIQHVILKEKFNADPIIIYGLYQGVIGGPNIRKHAYTGKNVYTSLESNADEFVNSNRGTYSSDKKTFRVSSLYERNEDYFPSFKTDLKKHLLTHLSGSMRYKLEDSKRIKTNIDNWRVTDLYGTTRTFGGGTSTNSAALMDAIAGSKAGNGPGAVSVKLSSFVDSKNSSYGRFSKEQAILLQSLKHKTMDYNETQGVVTLTEMTDQEKSEEKEKKDK